MGSEPLSWHHSGRIHDRRAGLVRPWTDADQASPEADEAEAKPDRTRRGRFQTQRSILSE